VPRECSANRRGIVWEVDTDDDMNRNRVVRALHQTYTEHGIPLDTVYGVLERQGPYMKLITYSQ